MTDHCQKHGLEAGPDGKCVLCHREEEGVFKVYTSEENRIRRKATTILMGLLSLACFICFGWMMLFPETFPVDLGKKQAEKAEEKPVIQPESIKRGADRLKHGAQKELGEVKALDNVHGRNENSALPDQTGHEKAGRTPPLVADTAARDSKLTEMLRDFRNQAVSAARNRVKIEVFTVSWCPHCAKALDYMDSRGISYTNHDVESDPAAKKKRDFINPRKTVPTFLIDNAVQVGFSPSGLENAINTAAERRVKKQENW